MFVFLVAGQHWNILGIQKLIQPNNLHRSLQQHLYNNKHFDNLSHLHWLKYLLHKVLPPNGHNPIMHKLQNINPLSPIAKIPHQNRYKLFKQESQTLLQCTRSASIILIILFVSEMTGYWLPVRVFLGVCLVLAELSGEFLEILDEVCDFAGYCWCLWVGGFGGGLPVIVCILLLVSGDLELLVLLGCFHHI